MGDSSVSNSSSTSVRDSGRDNDRQIDDLKNAHDKKMAALRAQQEKEEANARLSGEAAVNHIRKSTQERIQQARNESEGKVGKEDEAISQTYNSLKARASKQTEINEKEISASRDRAALTIQSDKRREDQAMQQSQEKLKDFLAKQRDLRAQTETKSTDEIRALETRDNQLKRKAQSESERDLREIDMTQKEKIHDLTEQNNSNLSESKFQAEHRLSQLRRDNDLKLKHERDQGNATFLAAHQKAHDEVEKEQQTGRVRLSTTVEENQRKLEANRDRSLSTNEKLQREYSGEAQRLEMEGNIDVNQRKEKFNHLALQQKEEQKQELKSIAANQDAKKDELRSEGETHIKETVEKLAETLHKKTEQFQAQYKAEELANRNTLNNQKEVFLKEQYKQRRAQNGSMSVDRSREGDAFYQPKSFAANLSENEDSYVLSAKVPAHEKENVEVRVQDNKVILSGARAFKDSFKDEKSQMETSSHQTYRQEFDLPKPADAKRVVTQIKDDGTITAFIPKKGFSKI
jgi:HSP20 family molecular chaperone IbpA